MCSQISDIGIAQWGSHGAHGGVLTSTALECFQLFYQVGFFLASKVREQRTITDAFGAMATSSCSSFGCASSSIATSLCNISGSGKGDG